MNDEEIVKRALAYPDREARADFLARVCGDDPRRIALLDERIDSVQDSLQLPPPSQAFGLDETQDRVDAVSDAGTKIGQYRLLRPLGEGGMGTVYLAEQREPVNRQVALKIIKAGMDTEQVIARFESERQALAMMNHPHIAKVLDAGTTEDGLPYFVMEYVPGTPITQYCDTHKLGIRDRLQLICEICGAIQHAHQKGIIHRDLKPSNVLVAEVDGKLSPKVIDFGLAKATNQRLTEKTLFTAPGQVLGTLEYMSPEQAGLNEQDIDTRTDIYSLGVIAYELLTGSTPLKRQSIREAGLVEILRRIQDEEAVRPSSRISASQQELKSISEVRKIDARRLASAIKGDLDWIVLKAMDKERNRRYESAAGLAADFQRYLNDEPVVARPASFIYRLRKTIRRNRAGAVSVAIIVLLLIGGTIVSSWQAIRATRAERESTKRFTQARRALDSMSSLAIDELLAQQTKITPSIRDMLQESLILYEEFAADLGDQPGMDVSLADAYMRVGSIKARLGIDNLGRTEYIQAADIYEQVVEDRPEDQEALLALIDCNYQIAHTWLQQEKLAEAMESTSQMDALLNRYRQRFGADAASLGAKVDMQYMLAGALQKQAKYEKAESLLRAAIESQNQLIADRSDKQQSHQSRAFLASLLQALGLARRYQNDTAGARFQYSQALEILNQLDNEGQLTSGRRMRQGVLLNDMGVAYFHDKDYARAESQYQLALEVRQQNHAMYPNDIDHAASLGGTLLNLGNLYRIQRRPQESLEFYNQGIATLERVRQRDPGYAWGNGMLRSCYLFRTENSISAGRLDEALKDLDHFAVVYRERYPNSKTLPPRPQLRRALVLAKQNKIDQAKALVEKVNDETARLGDDLDHAETAYYTSAVFADLSTQVDAPPAWRQRALEELKMAIQGGVYSCYRKEIDFDIDPDFAPLKQAEGFLELVELKKKQQSKGQ